jgi:hypothetical protein
MYGPGQSRSRPADSDAHTGDSTGTAPSGSGAWKLPRQDVQRRTHAWLPGRQGGPTADGV